MSENDQPATEGRIVHVRKDGISHCIPAIVVRNWNPTSAGSVNVLLFPDGGNDQAKVPPGMQDGYVLPWETSVGFDSAGAQGDRTWHWPERVS